MWLPCIKENQLLFLNLSFMASSLYKRRIRAARQTLTPRKQLYTTRWRAPIHQHIILIALSSYHSEFRLQPSDRNLSGGGGDDEQEQRQGVEAGVPEAGPVEGEGRAFVDHDDAAPRRRQRQRPHDVAAPGVVLIVVHRVAAELVRVVRGQPGSGRGATWRRRGGAHGPGRVPPVHDVRDAVPGGPQVPSLPQRRAARLQRRRPAPPAAAPVKPCARDRADRSDRLAALSSLPLPSRRRRLSSSLFSHSSCFDHQRNYCIDLFLPRGTLSKGSV